MRTTSWVNDESRIVAGETKFSINEGHVFSYVSKWNPIEIEK